MCHTREKKRAPEKWARGTWTPSNSLPASAISVFQYHQVSTWTVPFTHWSPQGQVHVHFPVFERKFTCASHFKLLLIIAPDNFAHFIVRVWWLQFQKVTGPSFCQTRLTGLVYALTCMLFLFHQAATLATRPFILDSLFSSFQFPPIANNAVPSALWGSDSMCTDSQGSLKQSWVLVDGTPMGYYLADFHALF